MYEFSRIRALPFNPIVGMKIRTTREHEGKDVVKDYEIKSIEWKAGQHETYYLERVGNGNIIEVSFDDFWNAYDNKILDWS